MIRTLVKELIEENNDSIKNVSKQTGLTTSTLTKWYDNSITTYANSTLDKLMKYFDLSNVNQILFYIDDENARYDFSLYDL